MAMSPPANQSYKVGIWWIRHLRRRYRLTTEPLESVGEEAVTMSQSPRPSAFVLHPRG